MVIASVLAYAIYILGVVMIIVAVTLIVAEGNIKIYLVRLRKMFPRIISRKKDK